MNACLLWLSVATVQSFDSLPPPTPMPAILAPAPIHPLTLSEFAAGFQPVPGNYEVIFIHPVKCCPVKVSFCLPPGCPQVRVSKRMLTFDYGHHHYVRITFKILCGGVVVTSR
jgi:hypothetical protein